MRTEVKVGIAVAVIAIAVVAFWMMRARPRLESIPIDKSAMDAAGGANFAMNVDRPAARSPEPARRDAAVPPASAQPPGLRPRPQPAQPITETAPPRPALRPPPDKPAAIPPGATGAVATERTPILTPPVGDRPDQSPPDEAAAPTSLPASPPLRPATDTRAQDASVPGGSRPPVVTAPPRPADAARSGPVSGAASALPAEQSYVIQQGDTLIQIADAFYGDYRLWPVIKQANPGLDENRLLVGKTIVIPPKERVAATAASGGGDRPSIQTADAGSAAAAAGSTYVVGPGDTLIKIARNVLKDGSRWREIYELNRDKLRSPDHIEVGMELKLPGPSKERG